MAFWIMPHYGLFLALFFTESCISCQAHHIWDKSHQNLVTGRVSSRKPLRWVYVNVNLGYWSSNDCDSYSLSRSQLSAHLQKHHNRSALNLWEVLGASMVLVLCTPWSSCWWPLLRSVSLHCYHQFYFGPLFLTSSPAPPPRLRSLQMRKLAD